MASPDEIARFKHEALPDASTYIRLLEVTSADPAGPARDISVRCRLTTWPKASAPAYTAISYTWGDPSLVTTILVNGGRMTVRRNCEDVLRQQCWPKGGQFWIDAICINQDDNDEKNSQVAGMGEVYRDARQTLAFVGSHADDSELIFETLHEHRRGYMEHHGCLSDDTSGLTDYLSRMLSDDSTLERLDKPLRAFFRRSYFQRVWIYQELFFGKNTHFCCGHETVELSLMWALYMTIGSWMVSPWMTVLSPWNRGPVPQSMLDRQSQYYFDNYKQLLRAAATAKKPLELSIVVEAVQRLQCEDPRDRVFGTLAMVDWDGEAPIRPDYQMDPFDLTVEVLQRIKWIYRYNLTWALEDTIKIAYLVGRPHISSRRLGDEILARRSRWHKPSNLFTRDTSRKIVSQATKFWGYRIYSHNAGWRTLADPSKDVVDELSAFRHEESTDPTSYHHYITIQKWSEGMAWDVHATAVLLPAEAEDRDWLLIPDLANRPYAQASVALIARDGWDGQPQIVGKALFAVSENWPWTALQLEGSKFGVYLDHEDTIVLADSCNWDVLGYPFSTNADEGHEFQVDNYFQTRLYRERSRTCAVRMDQ
ncbi:hypothetical protein KVR01_009303 [Diaporthe batatas]|uniref:uncharacterized protein n=1 Tax=Diaporthe batatas TaxID=748121 RepID=UPI001D036F5D|nr:uncharacterized protein KVR01_009303 [Diaporthe batatas]KAG8161039.1 hypothetical protein KVR01_009303 [Diaporthe batatas]